MAKGYKGIFMLEYMVRIVSFFIKKIINKYKKKDVSVCVVNKSFNKIIQSTNTCMIFAKNNLV